MRLYSEAEARALLPEVIPVLEALRDAYVALRAIQASIAAEARGARGDGDLPTNAFAKEEQENEVDSLHDRLQAAAARIEEWGIELKDPEQGLVDFYSRRDGEVVYLCYRLGDPGLQYWHNLEAGFAGRQPL
jgi:hypothetical protein